MLLLICGLLPVVLGGLLPFLRMKSRTVRMVYAMLSSCAVSGLLLYLIFTEQGHHDRDGSKRSELYGKENSRPTVHPKEIHEIHVRIVA